MSEAKPVWLVGMMGAGKSSVGAVLARRMGRPFVDLDREIEEAAGHSVSEIFAHEGEAGFRGRERRAIEGAADEAAVVALGGGAVVQPGVCALLAHSGTIVYLRATPAQLLARVGEAQERPLLAGLDDAARLARLEALLREREPAYRCAPIQVDTGAAGVEDVAVEVEHRLRELEQES